MTPALYSTDSPGKRNKTWHDCMVVYAEGCLVLKDENGAVLLRQHTPYTTIAGKLEFSLGRFTIQLDQPISVEDAIDSATLNISQGMTVIKKRGPSKFAIKYRSSTHNNHNYYGIAEYDGKSLVVFKDSNMRMFHRKICPGISQGEQLTSGPYIIEVVNELPDDNDSKRNIYTRKTLVSKAASAAARDPSTTNDENNVTNDPTNVENSNNNNNNGNDQNTLTVFKCIFTEDKHKKNQKKWIDGVLKLDSQGLAVIEDEDTNEVVLKRHFKRADLLKEGYEFDGGKYRFQITETPHDGKMPRQLDASRGISSQITRKRLLTVSEIRSRKDDLLSSHPHNNVNHDTDADDADEIHSFFGSHPIKNEFKKAKSDSMFDMFDD